MNKTPTNQLERDFQDNYRATRLAAIDRQMSELRAIDARYQRTENVNNDDTVL